MSQIKKFIDKIAYLEVRQSRELIMPLADAKELRDELLKILLDQRDNKSNDAEVIEVVMRGNKF
jgi:hypothetical protein